MKLTVDVNVGDAFEESKHGRDKGGKFTPGTTQHRLPPNKPGSFAGELNVTQTVRNDGSTHYETRDPYNYKTTRHKIVHDPNGKVLSHRTNNHYLTQSVHGEHGKIASDEIPPERSAKSYAKLHNRLRALPKI